MEAIGTTTTYEERVMGSRMKTLIIALLTASVALPQYKTRPLSEQERVVILRSVEESIRLRKAAEAAIGAFNEHNAKYQDKIKELQKLTGNEECPLNEAYQFQCVPGQKSKEGNKGK